MRSRLLTICLIGTVIIAAGQLAAKGSLKFKETSLSFGEITAGQVADLQFEFSNSGDSLLVIKQVNSTCGCTVTQLSKKEYQPGESGVIPVRFFSRGYHGRVIKSISVLSNDEENSQTRLQITGVVNLTEFPDIQIVPKEINLGMLPLSKPTKQILTIRNPGNLELRLTQVQHSPDLYLVFPKTILAPAESIEVELTYNPSRPGKFSTYVLLTSNALGKGQEMVRVEAEVSER